MIVQKKSAGQNFLGSNLNKLDVAFLSMLPGAVGRRSCLGLRLLSLL